MRNSQGDRQAQIEDQEQVISELKQDCFNMQEEVQKALKIHRANKELNAKNSVLKQEMERLKQEHRQVSDGKIAQIKKMEE